MTQRMDPPPQRNPGSVAEALAQSEQRNAYFKAKTETAAKEVSIWRNIQLYQSQKWWFHLRALFEREAKFFAGLRESESPRLWLEELITEATRQTEELLHELPRNIEQMAQRHGLRLDNRLSGHGRNFDHEMKDSQKSSSYTNSCVEDIQNCQLS